MTLVLTSLTILASGAFASLLIARAPRLSLSVSMVAMVAAALVALTSSLETLSGAAGGPTPELQWPLPLGVVHLKLDSLSAWFLMSISILSACVGLYVPAYMRQFAGKEPVAAFGALLCGLQASLILVVCAGDAVLFLVAWELMTLTAFFLVMFHHIRPEVRRGAWMYLIATHIGTALCVLPLFGTFYASAHTTNFTAFPIAMESAGPLKLILVFTLAVLGFGVKAGFMPMHVWLPEAHPVAPTPVSALLSGVVVKTGIYGLLRLLTWLPPLPSVCGYALLIAGIVSGVMGVLYALAQHDLKRLLAYHTVENIGIIAIGIAVGMLGQTRRDPIMAALGYTGALLHVANHALFKGLLFLSAGAVLHGTGTTELERLGGLIKKTPINATMFLIGAVAICGLPPLNGFVSEWVVYGALFRGLIHAPGATGGMLAFGILSLALMGGLALACFAKVFGTVFLGESRDAAVHVHPTPIAMKTAMAVLALLCVLIGIAPHVWTPLAYAPAGLLTHISVLDAGEQIERVLASGNKLTTMACVFVCIVAGLIAVRRIGLSRSLRRFGAGGPLPVSTWGCGFAGPTPRMQYSATSFASPLMESFRGVLWPVRTLIAPAGAFPARSHMETHTPDIAEKDFFQPVFLGIARLFAMARTVSWTGSSPPANVAAKASPHAGPLWVLLYGMTNALRRGSIQVCILFIVLTLVAVFLFEGLFSPAAAPTAAAETQKTARVEDFR